MTTSKGINTRIVLPEWLENWPGGKQKCEVQGIYYLWPTLHPQSLKKTLGPLMLCWEFRPAAEHSTQTLTSPNPGPFFSQMYLSAVCVTAPSGSDF